MARRSARARRFEAAVAPHLDGDPVGVEVLEEVCAAIELLDSLRAQIRRDGVGVAGSMRQPRAHPAVREISAHQLVLDRLLDRLRVRLEHEWRDADELSALLSAPTYTTSRSNSR